MDYVTITDCKTQYNAAGIYFNKGNNLKLEHCKIEKCKGKGSRSSGGIDIQASTGTVNIKDTAIETCEATGTNNVGGGIYSDKEFTLKNTTVTGNEATMSGGAIQIATADSVFNMSGSTVITVEPSGVSGKPSKNDIYLTNTAFITLTGKLTATEKIARITLNSLGCYQENRVVVKGGGGFIDSLSDYKNKFTITDKITTPKKWKLIFKSKALQLKPQ